MYSRDSLSLIVDDATSGLTERELSEQLEAQLAGLSESERESFDDVLRTVGAGAQRALPGVIQGATTGAAAGPWGALIGGVAGGAVSLATSGGGAPASPRPTHAPPSRPTYTPPPPPAAPPSSTYTAPSQPVSAPMAPSPTAPTPASTSAAVTTPVPAVPAAMPSAPSNPAAQLLWAMQNPRVLQAVASLVAGPVGRQEVAVDNTSAARGAFLNMLNVLTSQASEQAEMYAEAGHDAYLRDSEGDYAWDVVNPEARARALMVRLRNDARTRETRDDSAGAWLLRSGLVELDAELSW